MRLMQRQQPQAPRRYSSRHGIIIIIIIIILSSSSSSNNRKSSAGCASTEPRQFRSRHHRASERRIKSSGS